MAETCSTCRWFLPLADGLMPDPAGQCLVNPPFGWHQQSMAKGGELVTSRPVTFEGMTCREWTAKPGPHIGRHDPYPGYDPLDIRPLPADQGGGDA